ncbi:MAG TPA: M48 family metallopeptidase, partial [Thermoanaerobaculia bacterium]|nr:M48 family metallopeptidase [Thermoanaerobaculia bacterium]
MKLPSRLAPLGLAILVLAVASCATNPVTGKKQLILVSEEQELAIGAQQYAPSIQQSYGKANDAALQTYVQRVGAGLAAVSHRPQLPYEFTVVNANYLNAFALPGGKICVTRGLLSKMTTEDQLAGVLGHEIGHVTARHGAQGMTRSMITQGLLAVGTIALAATETRGAEMIVQAAGIGAQLVLLRYSRDQERQSDELGMEYMSRAGYNPAGFVESMRLLADAHAREPSKLEAMFQSHPLTSERIATAEARAKESYTPLLSRPVKSSEFVRAAERIKAEVPAFRRADEGEKLLQEKRPRESAVAFAEAGRLAPDEAILPALEALARLSAEDPAAARESARRAVRLDGGLFHARL